MVERTIVFAGGGSGGHLFPALAVARKMLERRNCDRVLFLTSARDIDIHIMSQAVRETPSIQWVPEIPFPAGRSIRRLMAFPAVMLKARKAALRILKEFRPSLCVGIGAFASVAASIVCARRGIPLALMEQNVVPGRATRFLSRYADLVLAGLPIADPESSGIRCPVVTTGVPVRASISALTDLRLADSGPADSALPKVASERTRSQRSLLIVGGSQGATTLNELVSHVVTDSQVLPEDWTVTHQTGQRDAEHFRTLYASRTSIQAHSFVQMDEALRTADLVISRSGAGMLAEIACAGVASILIPHPTSSGHHQLRNAEYFRDAGAASRIEQNSRLASQTLANALHDLAHDSGRRQALGQNARKLARPEAASCAADALLTLITNNKKGTPS